MKAIRWASVCEYARLATDGYIGSDNAPFAAISTDDDLSDCIPATVPVGTIMMWSGTDEDMIEADSIGWAFGPVRIEVEVPDSAVLWRGCGRYGAVIEDYDGHRRVVHETLPEIAVAEISSDWVVSIDDSRVDYDHGYGCYSWCEHTPTCPQCEMLAAARCSRTIN